VSKRTRNRHLARQAAKRYAEKRQRQRRRQLGTIAVALVVALAGGVFAFIAFTGDEPAPAASGASGPTFTGPTGPTQPTGPTGDPGTQTGTVDPTAGPDEVACGGDVPDGADRPKPQFNAPGDAIRSGRTYTATFQTSCGDIVIELLAEQAPETVNSFVFLAQEGYFDGQRIHRLDDSIDVIQGGDPTGTGSGGPGYSIPDELTGEESYGPGIVAMANAGPNTGGSQFFIITGEDGHNLDSNPAYTVFGTVVEGLDIAEEILALPIQDPAAGIAGQQPAQALYLEQVTIEVGRGESN
jgi:cyclophilin family peptidyl-prolyl cis-trans isomerase